MNPFGFGHKINKNLQKLSISYKKKILLSLKSQTGLISKTI